MSGCKHKDTCHCSRVPHANKVIRAALQLAFELEKYQFKEKHKLSSARMDDVKEQFHDAIAQFKVKEKDKVKWKDIDQHLEQVWGSFKRELLNPIFGTDNKFMGVLHDQTIYLLDNTKQVVQYVHNRCPHPEKELSDLRHDIAKNASKSETPLAKFFQLSATSGYPAYYIFPSTTSYVSKKYKEYFPHALTDMDHSFTC